MSYLGAGNGSTVGFSRVIQVSSVESKMTLVVSGPGRSLGVFDIMGVLSIYQGSYILIFRSLHSWKVVRASFGSP